MVSDDEFLRQAEAMRRLVEQMNRSGAIQELARSMRAFDTIAAQQAEMLRPMVKSFQVFAVQTAQLTSVAATVQSAYSTMARDLVRGLEPMLEQFAATRAMWLRNVAPQFSALAAVAVSASSAIPTVPDEETAGHDPEPSQELTSRSSLRLLTRQEMKNMLTGAAALLGGEAAVAQIIREYVGPDASPTDVLLWSAGIMLALITLVLAATDLGQDD